MAQAPTDFQRNNLDRETSPYLHQHRDNPVHWQPWGPEVLAHARATDKPILLSVGYAACHWCHVMAHESFENPAIAAEMNRLFVNIKVDREERPDIDAIYQTALHLLGQQGGWPLTMFLTPDGEPFWGGTYFPGTPRYGRPGFTDVLVAIEDTFRNGKEKVEQNRKALADALARLSNKTPGPGLPADAADQAADALVRHVDLRHGGIGEAPKFPHVPGLDLLWRAHRNGRGESFARAVLITADAMAEGGIYDHLGGGWARYSVDTYWLAPHFEKMLYDNSQLIEYYSRLWLATGRPLYRQRVAETVAWVKREMTTAEGAFCSSLDADSLDSHGHSEEGAFYVWTQAEIEAVLAGHDADLFKMHYGVTPEGNWEGKTILNRLAMPAPDAAIEEKLAPMREVLFGVRAPRPRPGLDDKVLADWNGLMIRALVRAGLAMGEKCWVSAAQRAFDHIAATMSDGDRLHHSARDGKTLDVAMIDDYAAMADAALALHEASSDETLIEKARAWVAVADRHYWDERAGGYFFTADDAEALIVRTKTAIDNATPSGNGTMVGVNARLWLLTGEESCRDRAEAICATFADDVVQNPLAHGILLLNMDLIHRPVQVVIVGSRGEAATEALIDQVRRAGRMDLVLQVIADGAPLPDGHPATGKGAVDGKATAYVCIGPVCSLPVTTADALADLLEAAGRP
ncbi:MAG: thioredoxin domain-containing protein [Proteobacteria bacterium]|nr:thioredoxin domain-containing protein [Pseudomonadota bacterium]